MKDFAETDAFPTKPDKYVVLRPLSLYCTLMIVLYFIQGCFEAGTVGAQIFTLASSLSLVGLPVVGALIAWKYFRLLNAYHKALDAQDSAYTKA